MAMDEEIQMFVEEVDENLQNIDDSLVKLESQPDDTESLDATYRTLHTIKGTCGFFGFSRLSEVAHNAENLLSAFKVDENTGERTLEPTGDRMQVVFDTMDRIREILDGIKTNEGQEPQGDDTDITDRLKTVLNGEAEPAASQTGNDQDDSAAPSEPAQPEPNAGAADVEAERPDAGDDTQVESQDSNAFQGEKPHQEKADASQSSGSEKPAGKNDNRRSAKSGSDENGAGDTSGNNQNSVPANVRVSTHLLDNLQTSTSELVLIRNQLMQIDSAQENSPHAQALQRLNQIVSELQEQVTQTRMQEIEAAWKQTTRQIRDLNRELGKKIELTTSGGDAELDRQILESLKQPLTHIVRNAADHGVEKPEERAKAGKSETGRIHMRAHQEAGHVVIEIADDGKGLDADKIAKKAIEKGLATEDEIQRMSENAVRQFLFKPGFSTAAEVTNVSGRGVGMDVVRNDIEKIGGFIEVSSTLGQGTTFSLKIPLTLAIISALIVQSGGQRFAIPQTGVNEIVRIAGHQNNGSGAKVEKMQGARLLRLRERLLPLVSLKNTLDLEDDADNANDRYVVVTQVGSQKFGVIVDQIYDTEEIVVKPTSQLLSDLEYYSGCTILGDGAIVMILDPNGISPPMDESDKAERAEMNQGLGQYARDNADDEQDFLIFRTDDPTPKACPLNVIERIEKVKPSDVEVGDGRPLIQYRGDQMPLVPFDGTVQPTDPEGDQFSVLVFAENDRRIGIAVKRIDDIVKASMNVNWPSSTRGVLGTTVMNEKTTEIIDIGDYIQEFADWFKSSESMVAPENTTASQRTPRILYADDSKVVRGIMEPRIKQTGFDVEMVQDGAEALQRLQESEEPFDMVITDIDMPNYNGFQLADAIRKDENLKHLPLIALTGRNDERSAQMCLKKDFDEHVWKYDNADRLEEAILGLMESRAEAA